MAAACARCCPAQMPSLPVGRLMDGAWHSRLRFIPEIQRPSTSPTVHPDGTDLRLLTNTSSANAAFAPDYSPSGRRIVFSQSDADGCHLVISSVTGQHPRALPNGPGCLVDASWGPSRS